VLVASEHWASAFPGAVVGALVMKRVRNPELSAPLEVAKRALERRLREHPGELASRRVLGAYADYYRAHGKTYHVKAQWESVAVKNKPIPRRAALVEAMFIAELRNLMLTAGHDLSALVPPVRVEVTRDGDRYELMNGTERTLSPGDMMMVDGEGIISSVLHGPDSRTRITPGTREVLFAVYAPAGIGDGAVRQHLQDIRANVLLIAPEAETEVLTAVSGA
jgi:DNA/RNA-binding domain of Phe-tRNA-synthetase-like protein